MKVYVDLVFILNVWLDFIIVLAVSFILKKDTSIIRILLSSIVGSFSIFFLFIELNNLELFLFKFLVSLFIILIAFRFRSLNSFCEELIYFYMVSIILGGFITIIKDYVKCNSFVSNFILLSIVTPIILYFYYKKVKKINNHYNNLYNVDLYYKNNIYKFKAFLDTGNRLYDQYRRRPIVLIYTNEIKYDYTKGILVPFETANGSSVIRCLEADKIIINNEIVRKKVIFGLSTEKFNITDVDMILHNDLIGG